MRLQRMAWNGNLEMCIFESHLPDFALCFVLVELDMDEWLGGWMDGWISMESNSAATKLKSDYWMCQQLC